MSVQIMRAFVDELVEIHRHLAADSRGTTSLENVLSDLARNAPILSVGTWYPMVEWGLARL